VDLTAGGGFNRIWQKIVFTNLNFLHLQNANKFCQKCLLIQRCSTCHTKTNVKPISVAFLSLLCSTRVLFSSYLRQSDYGGPLDRMLSFPLQWPVFCPSKVTKARLFPITIFFCSSLKRPCFYGIWRAVCKLFT
jgi:hypothetical protein